MLIRLFQQATSGSIKPMPGPPFPKTLREFQTTFGTEEACQKYLAACRWPDGFVCPRCGQRRAYELVQHRRWQCVGCRHQVSLTAGTILHNTKTPLTVWFWAAYLMTTDKRDVWTFVAIEAQTKLVISWLMGRRDAGCATEFIQDGGAPEPHYADADAP